MKPLSIFKVFAPVAMVVALAVCWIYRSRAEGTAISQKVRSTQPTSTEASPDWPAHSPPVEVQASPAAPIPAKKQLDQAPAGSRGPASSTPESVNLGDVRDLIRFTHQQQQIDPVWAREAKGTVRDHLVKSITDHSVLKSIDCRTSICEATIEHDTAEDFGIFMDKAFKKVAFKWPGEVFVAPVTLDRSKVAMLVYVSREGTHLPAFDEPL